MAVTKGHGNPNWNREETILALDLYFSFSGVIPAKSHHSVQELSEFLRSLPYHEGAKKNATFRNVDGVYFELQNIRNALTGEGLSNISNMDREVASQLGGKVESVKKLAHRIRRTVQTLAVEDYEVSDDFEDNFLEGRSIFTAHRKTERNKSLRKKFLKRYRDGELCCEVCGMNRADLGRDIQEALFEVHHIVPLADLDGSTSTKLSDLALVCATCHRAVHKLMNLENRGVGIVETRSKLGF